MSAGKWTKGPYRTVESMAGVIAEIKAGDVTICDIRAQGVNGKYSNVVTDATATLLAAAPELAEALAGILDCYQHYESDTRTGEPRRIWLRSQADLQGAVDTARAALRKAGAGE